MSFCDIPHEVLTEYLSPYLTTREAACLVYASTRLLHDCKPMLKNNRETEINKILQIKLDSSMEYEPNAKLKREKVIDLYEYIYQNMDVLFLCPKFKTIALSRLYDMYLCSGLRLHAIKYAIKFKENNIQNLQKNSTLKLSFVLEGDKEMLFVANKLANGSQKITSYYVNTIMSIK